MPIPTIYKMIKTRVEIVKSQNPNLFQNKIISPHSFRRTFATDVYNQTKDIVKV